MKSLMIAASVLLMGCGGAAHDAPASRDATASLDAALQGPQRPTEERARDAYRHPRETLAFFGLRDSMTVIELSPGQGWYTAVLGPVLHDRGKLLVTSATPDAPAEAQQNAQALKDRLAKSPELLGKVALITPDMKSDYSLGPDSSADMVVTFRSLHGWTRDGNLTKVFGAAFRVLKPGGVFGVVQHRAKEGSPTDAESVGKTGYVTEAFAIGEAEKAGFKLVAKSEVNANPKDTKDYPKGVWTLPPTYTDGANDRARYAAIGESDRMTLKFVKP